MGSLQYTWDTIHKLAADHENWGECVDALRAVRMQNGQWLCGQSPSVYMNGCLNDSQLSCMILQVEAQVPAGFCLTLKSFELQLKVRHLLESIMAMTSYVATTRVCHVHLFDLIPCEWKWNRLSIILCFCAIKFITFLKFSLFLSFFLLIITMLFFVIFCFFSLLSMCHLFDIIASC